MAQEVANLCKIEASVPTGLEVGASEECTEVLGRAPEYSRGRVTLQLRSLEELQAVNTVYLLIIIMRSTFF